MKITYIFRKQSNQRSIERVFMPVIDYVKGEETDVDIEFAKSGSNLISTLWKNMIYFRKISKSRLCHITGDIQYVACLMKPHNTILTIHDLVPLHNSKVPWYSKLLCYWLWYYIPLRRLKHITCISETTRKDLISYFPWAKNKIKVIANPIDSNFKYSPKEITNESPRILHIGTKANKNLIRVIEALEGINCHLRIVGDITQDQLTALKKHAIDYSNVFGISDEQIIEEYKHCDIVSFPSLFEGFGMPIIEAQATGRIVVTSDLNPMKTVAGKAAILVDPKNVASIRKGFIEAIRNPQAILIEKGIKNAEKYSIESIGADYYQLYNKMKDK